MGVYVSQLWGTGRTDDADPVTGLTSRDKYLITKTWARLSNGDAAVQTGVAIFLALFKKHPKYHQLFPFRDTPLEELPKNNRFRAHCVSLMYSFTSIVQNIENTVLLQELLTKQGVAHVPRKVPVHAYEELRIVLMELFSTLMNDEEQKSWEKFLKLGFSIISDGATKASEKI
ncbi:hypothetical protein GWI33_002171 [Rhynchophorus ferrugineus]|uniref:Globin domain-containing protein n=1 Tax=Rhynchophorus ferrugineus TaxID=354439 RepID=A0A834MHR1_RHYFE|nr:hypothetical protein GWI33_002171 [Rhynchophorus ferrugineus]